MVWINTHLSVYKEAHVLLKENAHVFVCWIMFNLILYPDQQPLDWNAIYILSFSI